jgi:plastocyanin
VTRRGRIAIAITTTSVVAGCGTAQPPERAAVPAPRPSSTPAHHRTLGDATIRTGRRATPAAARRAAGYLRQSGRGSAFLPVVRVKPGSTMTWTNSGSFFQVFDQHDVVAVTSVAHAGVAALRTGRERLQVNATGHWTIRITPPRS